jgi:hypothetical protein
VKFDLGAFVKICGEKPNWVKIGEKIREAPREDLNMLYCCRRHNVAIRAFNATEMA